ncbi:MAG: cellulose biosynthesis protein BcsD, partial [Gammaproteobacteria bacterium]
VKQQQSLMETTHHLLRYYADQHCSRQWSSFLFSLGQELDALAEQDELRPLMRQVGKRMAGQMPLPPADTLEDVQAAMNQQWDRIGWGWVSLEEKPEFLLIKHSAAPLQSAFGAGSLSWSPALLEGIYERWFVMAGAGDGLSVSQYQQPSGGAGALPFEFHLSATRQTKLPGTTS